MPVDQAVYALANRVREMRELITTEEATKTALIIPFITNVLGYDVSDPREVIPEYTADVGIKRGEKVDFAIKAGDDFRFLIECKKIGEPLNLQHANQLVRYFNVTDTEFAILTNGEVYEFYTQLDAANRMDERPFMRLDLGNVDARIFPHLEMCTKARFDSETISASAEELKYVAALKEVLAAEFKNPDAEWVKLLAARVTSRRMTAANLELFTKLVTTATSQFLKDEANRRLKSAQDLEEAQGAPAVTAPVSTEAAPTEQPQSQTDIVTTEEELQAFHIIQAICCAEIPTADVVMRDAKSYCAILFRDNNRTPIARLFFDRRVPRVVFFDEQRNEEVVDLNSIEEIYAHSDILRRRVAHLRDA